MPNPKALMVDDEGVPRADGTQPFDRAAGDFRFTAAVTSFGLLLRGSPHTGSATRESVLDWAGGALGRDPGGLRREFVSLVKQAKLPHLPVVTARR